MPTAISVEALLPVPIDAVPSPDGFVFLSDAEAQSEEPAAEEANKEPLVEEPPVRRRHRRRLRGLLPLEDGLLDGLGGVGGQQQSNEGSEGVPVPSSAVCVDAILPKVGRRRFQLVARPPHTRLSLPPKL